jgi:hypothetical protein
MWLSRSNKSQKTEAEVKKTSHTHDDDQSSCHVMTKQINSEQSKTDKAACRPADDDGKNEEKRQTTKQIMMMIVAT